MNDGGAFLLITDSVSIAIGLRFLVLVDEKRTDEVRILHGDLDVLLFGRICIPLFHLGRYGTRAA